MLWKVGLTLFMVPLGSVLASGFDPHDENGWVYGGLAVLPIGGPLYLAAFEGGTHHDAARAAGWAVAGLVQATGLAMLLVGAVGTGAIKIERAPLRFSVGPTVGGFEAGLRGAF